MVAQKQIEVPYRIVKSTGLVTGIGLVAASAGIEALQDHDYLLASLPGLLTMAWILKRGWPISTKTPPLELGVAFEVRESPGAGLGLFAKENIPAGTYIHDYLGEVLSEDEFEQRYGKAGVADYALELFPVFPWQESVIVDAQDPKKSNAARYMNHVFSDSPLYNVHKRRQHWPTRALRLFAAKDILPGDELCWDYGKDYWRGREDAMR